jgi:thiamine biosynthesis lipoprotein
VSDSFAYEWRATGTQWRVYHGGGLRLGVVEAVAAGVSDDEARWSRFRDDSELSRLNRHAGEEVAVDDETVDLLSACVRWHERTAGVFQPLVGATLAAWGYAESFDEEAPPSADRSPDAAPVTARLEVDAARGTARVPAGTTLDLGGIGKGWIAARTARHLALLAPGLDLLLDAGGDLVAVRGDHAVLVEHDGGAPAAWLRLPEGRAIATSGSGRRRWRNADGVEAHHLIDPATGAPAAPAHATVVAPDPVAADIWAKVLALRPERLAHTTLPALVTTEAGSARSDAWVQLASDSSTSASEEDPRWNSTVRMPMRAGSSPAGTTSGSGATSPGGCSG